MPVAMRSSPWSGSRARMISMPLRDRLIHEIPSLGSAEEAAQWARTALAAKNTLTASDARLLEVAFRLRLSALEPEGPPQDAGPGSPEAGEQANLSSEPLGPGWAVPRQGEILHAFRNSRAKMVQT